MDTLRLAIPPDAQAVPRVLLVEHPTPLAATLAAALKASAMEVEIAASMAEALHLLDRFHPGIVLLHSDGSALLGPDRISLVSRGGDCGVIVLLAEDGEAARIEHLDRGADDVLWARAPLGEVAARVRAVHRRVARPQTLLAIEPPAPVMLEPAHRCVIGAQGERAALSEAEFVALETLLDADGAPVSREWLGRVALKRPLHSDDRSVDQLVLKLRRKLVSVGASERTILSARRHGYMIADPTLFRILGPAAAAGPEGPRLVGAGT